MKSITLLKIISPTGRQERLKLSFAWYDFWIGVYVDENNRKLYICIIPTLLITIKLGND